MNNQKRKILALVLSSLFASASALASDHAVSASARGPGEGPGATTCNFVYSIQKIGPTLADRGETITYHVVVSNLGDCRLRHIDVRDRLPRGVDFVSATPAPTSIDHDTLHWRELELRAGRYLDVEITARVDNNPHGDQSLTNTGCAFSPWIGTEICDSVTTRVSREAPPME
jgi:uncharacterized repeat protein (TIGR01451 family)